MNAPFRSVDSLETEGDNREAYAEWMATMTDVAIVDAKRPLLGGKGITFAGIPLDDAGVFDVLPF
tara:strand:+ start:160 stop:354 length:195 start_codon:yes stop_codon:yes gene_type:complete